MHDINLVKIVFTSVGNTSGIFAYCIRRLYDMYHDWKKSIMAAHLLFVLHSLIGVPTRYLMVHLNSNREIKRNGRTALSGTKIKRVDNFSLKIS